MSETENEAGSRRERKRLETRNSLSQAALQLAMENDGLRHVTPDEIAERAGVSPRTFHNYFHSREAALGALPGDRARRVALAFGDRPADEPFGVALSEAIVAEYTLGHEPDKADVRKLRAIMSNCTVSKEALRVVMAEKAARPHLLEAMRDLEEQLTPVIADRLGLDPDQDLLPRIIAAAVNGAVRVATENWLRDDVDQPYTALLRQAVRVAAALGDQPSEQLPDPPSDRTAELQASEHQAPDPSPPGASLPENENP